MKEVDKNILEKLTKLTYTDYSNCTDINDLLDDLADTIELKNKKIDELENQPLEEPIYPYEEYGY